MKVKKRTSGRSSQKNRVTKPESPNAMLSGCLVVTLFGVISPKTSRRIVEIPVAIPKPLGPKISRKTEVSTTDNATFTISLPTRSMFRSSSFWSSSFPTLIAFLSPFSRRKCTRSLLSAKNALSLAEKSSESVTNVAAAAIRTMSPHGLDDGSSIRLSILYL